MPSRRAAMTFSLIPPTFKTLPVKVNSPVIAKFDLNGWLSARLTNAEAIVTPAEGPSFGVAPSGTFKWTCASSRNVFAGSSSRTKRRAYVSEMALDSFITLPNCPVTFMKPGLEPPAPPRCLPTSVTGCVRSLGCNIPSSPMPPRACQLLGNLPRASTTSVAPPKEVQAKPITTPGGVFPAAYSCSDKCKGWPIYSAKLSTVMCVVDAAASSTLASGFFRTTLKATLRLTFSNNCRRCLTPASRA
mmetsp:Transcript_60443/g.175054  ORF Transcript_60443/g.175054 Transcript_60443/m.175054 type:complete len:245 (+) Transcript_60443:293-1027(+)